MSDKEFYDELMAEQSMVSEEEAFKNPSLGDGESDEVEEEEEQEQDEDAVAQETEEEDEEEDEEEPEEEELAAADEVEEEEDEEPDELERVRKELEAAKAERERLKEESYARLKTIDQLRESRRQERAEREARAQEAGISEEDQEVMKDPVVKLLVGRIDGLREEFQRDKAMGRVGEIIGEIGTSVRAQADEFSKEYPDFEQAREHARNVIADFYAGPDAPESVRKAAADEYELNLSVYCLDNGIDAAERYYEQAQRYGYQQQAPASNGQRSGTEDPKADRVRRALGTARMQRSKVSGERENEFTRAELSSRFDYNELVQLFQEAPEVWRSLEETGKAKIPERFLNR